MKLTARIRQTGPGYRVDAGETFEVGEREGNYLIGRGLATAYVPPTVNYRTKVVTPDAPEVGAAAGRFRFVRDADLDKKVELPRTRPSLLSAPTPPEERTGDSRRRPSGD